jgi:hypothetical protein
MQNENAKMARTVAWLFDLPLASPQEESLLGKTSVSLSQSEKSPDVFLA